MASGIDTAIVESAAAAVLPSEAVAEHASPRLAPSRAGPSHGPSVDRQPRIGRRWTVSPLTRRILAVNVLALALLAGGFLYLGKYQTSLIGQQIESLKTQGEVFAAALGEGAVLDSVDEGEILLPDLARQMMRRLVEPTHTRARLFDVRGDIIADSRILRGPGDTVQVHELQSREREGAVLRLADRIYDGLLSLLPPYQLFGLSRERFAAGGRLYGSRAGTARRKRLRDQKRPPNRWSDIQRRDPDTALQAGTRRDNAIGRKRRNRGGAKNCAP